jgi:hypothetical protein
MRFSFSTLSQLSLSSGPKFVYAHIIAPHPPFVVDAEGNPIEPGYAFGLNDADEFPLGRDRYRDGYVGQVQFVNQQLKGTIDALLRNSARPPIILLQADHGPGQFTDFGSAERTCLKERLSVFSAYYLPGLPTSSVPPDITPVNLFRLIFNRYFGTELPLLPNRFFYNGDPLYLFRLNDVSSRVDTCTIPARP